MCTGPVDADQKASAYKNFGNATCWNSVRFCNCSGHRVKKARISQSRDWAEPIARQSTTTKETEKEKKKASTWIAREQSKCATALGGKALSLADTGGLCQNVNPVTFPASRVATGAGVTPRQLLCPASIKQRNFVDGLSMQMVLGPALPHFYLILFQYYYQKIQ